MRAKFGNKTIPKSPKLTELFLCNNCVYHQAGYITPCSSFSFKLTNGKTVLWLIFILHKFKIWNKELQNINQMLNIRIAALTGYPQNILETATKQSHIFKYFYSNMKKYCAKRIKRKAIHSLIEASIKSK